MMLVKCANAPSSPETLQRNHELDLKLDTEEKLKASLKDPSSAEFRNVRVSHHGGRTHVCGEVNAKNSFGGYTGFMRFVGSPALVITEETLGRNDKARKLFSETWAEACD